MFSLIDLVLELIRANPTAFRISYTFFYWGFFGAGYAVLVAWRPPAPQWTWASVVIGVFITIAPAAYIIWDLTGSLFLTALHAIGFSITGGLMIAGQLIVHQLHKREAAIALKAHRHWEQVERAKRKTY